MSALDSSPSATLDELASLVFEGATGQARLSALMPDLERQFGRLRPDDAEFERLQLMRLDWALCDASIPSTSGAIDTWARRARRGDIPGISPAAWAGVPDSHVGLFEVWPGEPVWLRDRLGGVCVPLLDSVAPWPEDARGPVACWEVRVIFGNAGAHLVRTPLDYPLSVLDILDRGNPLRFGMHRQATLAELHRGRAAWSMMPKRDPLALFGGVLVANEAR